MKKCPKCGHSLSWHAKKSGGCHMVVFKGNTTGSKCLCSLSYDQAKEEFEKQEAKNARKVSR